jgi:transcriptional regulator with XRE-family HTH domain
MAGSFGAALREKRRAAGLTQRDLADRAGIDFSYISKLENDRLPPPAADTVVKFATILSCSSEELLALTGKLPSGVQTKLSNSRAAQEFLRLAQEEELSEVEWQRLAESVRRLRRGRG